MGFSWIEKDGSQFDNDDITFLELRNTLYIMFRKSNLHNKNFMNILK